MTPAQPSQVGDHLVLIGPMGAGKSSLARHLSRLTSRHWVDTDRMVVDRSGRSIADIFAQQGESAFREMESEALRSLASHDRLVIATGGGIVTRAENCVQLRTLGCVIFLSATPEVLFERVSRNQRRPLLHTADPEKTLREIVAARLPLYTACAHVTVDTSDGTHEALAQEVVSRAQRFFVERSEAAATDLDPPCAL